MTTGTVWMGVLMVGGGGYFGLVSWGRERLESAAGGLVISLFGLVVILTAGPLSRMVESGFKAAL